MAVLGLFCKSMIEYVSKTEQNDLKFAGFHPLAMGINYSDINDNDICKWNQTLKSLSGCDILSMIRNMFMYTVLFGKTFDYDYNDNDKIGCIDVTCGSFTYQNCQLTHLHLLNSKIIDCLSYYMDLHHFEQMKLSDRVTLQFVSDFENQVRSHDDYLSNSNIKADYNQQHIAPNTMSFGTIVNEAANTNTLPYWNYSRYKRMQNSLIPQCLSTVRIQNFRYNNKCSLYIGTTNGMHYDNIYTCNSTRNLKFFNLCNAFQYFEKIEIRSKRGYGISDNLYAMNWIRNVCNENTWSDKSKSNNKREWIVFKTENINQDNQNNIRWCGYLSNKFVEQYFAPQSVKQLQALRNQSRDEMLHRVNQSQLKSKLYHNFIQKINGYNYNLFHNFPNNPRQYKHYKDYNAYLKGTDKDWITNINKNWVEMKYFRKHEIKNSDIENKFNYNRVKKQLGLHIETPNNNNILNIAVLYKQKEILKYKEIVLKLKQEKYGVFTTKHDGFDKLGKDIFLKSICINFLYPFEIFLLSRLNRGFYQLLHSNYKIIKKYLINREHETNYYLTVIKNTICMLGRDASVEQNLVNRVSNAFNDDISDWTVSEFWNSLLDMLQCFDNNNNKGFFDTSIHLFAVESPNIHILKVIGNHDHKTECGSISDNCNCDCNDMTAHPRLNILRQIGKMCLFWMLISGSKGYDIDTLIVNCHVITKFGLFAHLITVSQLISTLAFHCNYHDSNGDKNKCNYNVTKNIGCNNEIFLHNIDTIKCGNVQLILTKSKMHKMYSNDPRSFLIEYRACDSQFINYFDQFRYNRKNYNCFAKIGNELQSNDQQSVNTQGEKYVNSLICLHINKVFDKYWNHVIFGNNDACDKVDNIMEWLYGLSDDSWNCSTIKIILFSFTKK